MSSSTDLIFVYNANSGMMNAVLDSMHKIISPKTYSCALCKITYGTFTELPDWKRFREKFPGNMHFFHIDEFESKYNTQENYPIVLSKENNEFNTVLSSERLDAMRDLDELIQFFRDWAQIL